MNVRLLAVPALSLSLLALPSASAGTPTAGPTVQSYSGAFVAPTRFPDTATTSAEGGWPGAARKVYLAAQAADGIVGDVFPVDPRAAGGTFELLLKTEQTGSGQLDIYFYGDLASVADGTPESLGDAVTAGKGEKGFVPAGTEYAIVVSPNAVNPTFTFAAQQRPTIDLSVLDGTTVPAGTTLGLRNDSAGYASLKHVVTTGKPLVDRSAAGNGLRAGEVVDVVFAKAGSYVFETAAGRSTVTVSS